MPTVVTVTLNPALDLTVEVDELVAYRKLRGRLLALDPGGGGVNVARVLHRFDTPVVAVAALGGTSGQELLTELEREGVSVRGRDVGCRHAPLDDPIGHRYARALPDPG